MNCFTHSNSPANGLCKHCFKAVCPECAINTHNGLACSSKCAEEVNSYHSMITKSKSLYGLGKEGKQVPLQIIVYLVIGLVFIGISVYQYVKLDVIDYPPLIIGIALLAITAVAFIRNKKIGTNF